MSSDVVSADEPAASATDEAGRDSDSDAVDEPAGAESTSMADAQTPVSGAGEDAPKSEGSASEGSVSEGSVSEEASEPHVFCNQCGWENPADSNFCAQCGAKLQDVQAEPQDVANAPAGTRKVAADLPKAGESSNPATPTDADNPSAEKESAEDAEQHLMSQQLVMTVGTAILVVVGLFFVTLWSQSQSWSSESDAQPAPAQGATSETGADGSGASGGAPATPGSRFGGQDIATLIETNGTEMSASITERADSIKGQFPNVEGDVKRTLQEQLVNLYVGASAFGRAAKLQQEMSETSDATDDWRRTGDLFYNWMEKVGAESNGRNPAIAPIGRRAIAAYEEVLEQNPENHDVRTDMATVLLRSNNPMRGVEELNRVLGEDSTFVPARFNKGLALLWIGRYEQAIEQFEAVQDLAGETSPQYQQAAQAIELVREEMNANASSSSPDGPPISNPPASPSSE